MNRKLVLTITGQTLTVEAIALLIPAFVSLIYGEREALGFTAAAAIALAVGMVLKYVPKPQSGAMFEREGFAVVSLSWILMSLIGALPFVISGDIPSYVDAFFETVSGFTTTGASIINEVEKLSHAALLWRAMTHWIGGMGILVFVLMFGAKTSNHSMQILKAEMPGPVIGKLVPRARDTARALYVIYAGMTAAEAVLLMISGMPLFDAVFHSLGTAGTGGFGMMNDSLAGYGFGSQWIITVFMVLFAVNFNLYFYAVRGDVKSALQSQELHVFLGIVFCAVAIVTLDIRPLYGSLRDSLRLGSFQVASIISTTGFTTADFDRWPVLSRLVLFTVMFLGGCAGSTAGGLKTSRIIILYKTIRTELNRLLRPRRAQSLRLEGKPIEAGTVRSVSVFFAIYMTIYIITVFLVTIIERADAVTCFSAAAACLNNVGPGFALIGPSRSYFLFHPVTKIILAVAMLIGRLEVYPILLTLSVRTWTEK